MILFFGNKWSEPRPSLIASVDAAQKFVVSNLCIDEQLITLRRLLTLEYEIDGRLGYMNRVGVPNCECGRWWTSPELPPYITMFTIIIQFSPEQQK